MMHCKYCDKQIEENEVCSCRQEAKAKKTPVLLISIIGVLTIALMIFIVLLTQGNNPSEAPSIDSTQSNTNNNTNNNDNEKQDNSNITGGGGDNESSFTKINPFDFIDRAYYYGYDGQGEISVFIDRNALVTTIVGECSNTNDEEVLAEWLKKYMACEDAINDINISYSSNGSLKNGDIVTVTLVMPEFLAYNIENASKTYTVAGLPVVDFVEIFDEIKIIYDGNSGEALAYVERLSDSYYLNNCNFEITPNGYLSNGDEITVTITNKSCLMELYNVVPQTLSKTFTVKNLPEYIAFANQLPEIIIEYYSNRSLAETDTSDFFEYTYSAAEIDGIYFLTLKDGKYGYKNILSVIISYDKYTHGEYIATVYETYEYMNLTINSDGTFDHLNTKWGKFDTIYSSTIDTYLQKYEDDYAVADFKFKL